MNLFLVSGNFSLHWQVEDCYRNESAIGFLLHMFYYNSAIYSTVSILHELESLRMTIDCCYRNVLDFIALIEDNFDNAFFFTFFFVTFIFHLCSVKDEYWNMCMLQSGQRTTLSSVYFDLLQYFLPFRDTRVVFEGILLSSIQN